MCADVPAIVSIQRFLRSYHRREVRNPALTAAAVLLPLFQEVGRLHVLLTKRTETVEHHKGQISFPGGACDPRDLSLVDTALRETEEEIGLTREHVQVFGLIDDLTTPSGFIITPVVAFIPAIPLLHLHSHEVSEVLHVPLSFFLDPKNERIVIRNRNAIPTPVYHYHYGAHEIWGATAAILRGFLHELVASGVHV